MVQIYLKLNDEGPVPEYAIIELQGDLESSKSAAELSSSFIGDLHFTKEGIPVLIIGHHILHGKSMKMDKPFLILKKSPQTDNKTKEYNVQAVVKKKLIFKNRPKPIVTNLAIKN